MPLALPAIAATGRYFREIPLAPEITPKHYLDVAGEAPEDVEIKPAILDSFSRLVREGSALYQSHHYETYHFVLSLSDNVREEGLEHHQSSDNGLPEKGLSDESLAMLDADLLPHEFTHSWNGKYRRPIGLATPEYATPQRGDLLWVYEGMTQCWGGVLATRSGLWTPEQYKEVLVDGGIAGPEARPHLARPGRHRDCGTDPARQHAGLQQLADALKRAKGTSESNDNHFRTLKIDYHEGERYPHLERDSSAPDLLDDILKPLAPAAAATKQ